MKRLFIIYNPHSSRYQDVKKDVFSKQKNIKGYLIGKYEVEPTDVDQNATKFSKIIKDGDLVVSAGGDATGVIAANAILKSNKDATLAVLPYSNFNDLSRTLKTKTIEDILNGKNIKYYPLEIYIDNLFFRYATCYVTIGMTAEAVKLYDKPKMRKTLKTASGRNIGSYTNLASWYFKNRHKKQFIPKFRLNGIIQHKKTSDYAAINGHYMARVMKGREDYLRPSIFRSETDRLTSFWRLCKLMLRSIFFRIPGSETKKDVIEFSVPSSVEIQAEGEYKTLENINKIEIRKSKKCLRVITI